MASKKSKRGGGNGKFIIAAIIVVAIAVFFVFASLAQKVFQTETYYILNQDVPTRTQVTEEMMSPVTTSEGTGPEAALGLDVVQTGNVYTQYPLSAGDILTMSNVGTLDDISIGVPDEWVITNFSVGADDAVGGRIKRGYYFDMMVVTPEGAYYPFINVLTLDTTVNLNSASSNEAADSAESKAGQTSQYVVGMSPENAARLHIIMARESGNIKLMLTPRSNEYNRPQESQYDGVFTYTQEEDGTIWPGKSPNGELTDYTFRDFERDSLGRPISKLENCSEGNAKKSGEDCIEGDSTADAQESEQDEQEQQEQEQPEETPTN